MSQRRNGRHLIFHRGRVVYLPEGGTFPKGWTLPCRILSYYGKAYQHVPGLDGWYGDVMYIWGGVWQSARAPRTKLKRQKFKRFPDALRWLKRPAPKLKED